MFGWDRNPKVLKNFSQILDSLPSNGQPGYLTSRQLGVLPSLPHYIQDLALVAPLLCTADDDYQSIAPDLDTPDLNPEPPTYALTFCPVPGSHNLLCLANEDRAIHMQDTALVCYCSRKSTSRQKIKIIKKFMRQLLKSGKIASAAAVK